MFLHKQRQIGHMVSVGFNNPLWCALIKCVFRFYVITLLKLVVMQIRRTRLGALWLLGDDLLLMFSVWREYDV